MVEEASVFQIVRLFQIARMEAEDEGFVEVKMKYKQQFEHLLFQIEGKEMEDKDNLESHILVLLRRSLEDREKPWQRHLLVALVPAWLSLVAYAMWALANI